jgi:hypothetical protein
VSLVAKGKSGGNFKPLAEGLIPVVISKVNDLGEVAIPPQFQRPDGPKTRQQMQIEFSDGNGGSSLATYTVSTSDKATIVVQLKKAGISVPRESFDYSTLVGKQLQVLTEHATSKTSGKPYAKITSFAKPAAGQSVSNASATNGVPKANIPAGTYQATDEDVAF